MQSRNSIKIKGREKGGTDLLLMKAMVSIATFMKESRSGSVTAPSKPVRTLCSASADHESGKLQSLVYDIRPRRKSHCRKARLGARTL